jgi:transcriptional pleiotropic regulator of transition state genes
VKHIAMTRILDPLGRFTIPKEILYTCDFEPLDSIEFFIDTEKGTIILKRYIGQSCKFCQSTEGLIAYKDSGNIGVSPKPCISAQKVIVDCHHMLTDI